MHPFAVALDKTANEVIFRVGAGALQSVTYRLDGDVIGAASGAPYEVWWTLAPGRHALVAEALITALAAATPTLPPFYASAAETARGAAIRLLAYVKGNRADIVNYNRVRRGGRRISTAASEFHTASADGAVNTLPTGKGTHAGQRQTKASPL